MRAPRTSSSTSAALLRWARWFWVFLLITCVVCPKNWKPERQVWLHGTVTGFCAVHNGLKGGLKQIHHHDAPLSCLANFVLEM